MPRLFSSTFFCARSMALVIRPAWITSPSLRPMRSIIEAMRPEPNRRIRSSSSDTKNCDDPGSLTPGTSAQLTVHTAAFVPLGADDGKTARLFHFGCQLDVGTAAGHVGGDGHLARTSGFGDDLRFQLVLFGVQYVMFDAAQLEHAAQKFRYFDRGGTHEHRTALFDEFDDLLDHGVYFSRLVL